MFSLGLDTLYVEDYHSWHFEKECETNGGSGQIYWSHCGSVGGGCVCQDMVLSIERGCCALEEKR